MTLLAAITFEANEHRRRLATLSPDAPCTDNRLRSVYQQYQDVLSSLTIEYKGRHTTNYTLGVIHERMKQVASR